MAAGPHARAARKGRCPFRANLKSGSGIRADGGDGMRPRQKEGSFPNLRVKDMERMPCPFLHRICSNTLLSRRKK
ncbi:hypothetical protein HMPREF3038_02445 [Akkermansia sp. KLE1797]|nr:hypothetical protein HMPREF3038_02445 [Akkermansia sp. KLE1797]KXU54822.1 hypothetical protein HMPREF3039_00969 [Akkermansia sp. KLE1798]KZA06210.1 hypothetical protein HMPREF1326_00058 [Akkermansia sp. KLE1605]